jgi:hypothetical protein
MGRVFCGMVVIRIRGRILIAAILGLAFLLLQ